MSFIFAIEYEVRLRLFSFRRKVVDYWLKLQLSEICDDISRQAEAAAFDPHALGYLHGFCDFSYKKAGFRWGRDSLFGHKTEQFFGDAAIPLSRAIAQFEANGGAKAAAYAEGLLSGMTDAAFRWEFCSFIPGDRRMVGLSFLDPMPSNDQWLKIKHLFELASVETALCAPSDIRAQLSPEQLVGLGAAFAKVEHEAESLGISAFWPRVYLMAVARHCNSSIPRDWLEKSLASASAAAAFNDGRKSIANSI